jgi:uncharacterized repeat protein (TIGR01451 family)
VGGEASFEVQLINRSGRILENVTILDRFGTGLQHATGATSIQRTEKQLPIGETKIGLTFTVTQPGKNCHTVEVSVAGQRVATAQGCVEGTGLASAAEQPVITLTKSGPQRLRVGEVGLYKIEVTNNGSRTINGLTVKETWARGLKAIQATEGNETTGENELTWRYDKPLDVGGRVLFEVRYEATEQVIRSCATATATVGAVTKSQELCVEVSPPASPPLNNGTGS